MALEMLLPTTPVAEVIAVDAARTLDASGYPIGAAATDPRE